MSENGDGARAGLPDGWKRLDLESVAGEEGLFVDGDWILSADLKTGEDVRLLQLGDIGVGAFLDKSSKWISRQRYEELACTEVRAGDILISRMAEPIARACRVPDLGCTCITAVDVTICRCGDPRIDPEWVVLALNSPSLRLEAEKLSSGTTRKRITRKKLARLLLPVPPLDEQRRIVSYVGQCFAQIEAAVEPLEVASSHLATFRAALLQQAVAIGEERTVGELLEGIEAGRSFRCHAHAAPIDKWGVIKVSAMTWGAFREEENKEVLDESHVDARWEIQSGDLLISRANTSAYVGAAVLVSQPRPKLLLSDKSLRLVPNRAEVSPAWLCCALNAPESREQMAVLATGTSDSMRNLSQDKLRAIRLRVPPMEEQDRLTRHIVRHLSMEQVLRGAIAAQQETTASLRRTVLQDAARGCLNLVDARTAA